MENRERVEKIARNATNLLTWLNKNMKVLAKKYTFEEIKQRPIKFVIWLERNCLDINIVENSKRVEIYPIYCKRLAVRQKFM